MAKPKGHLVQYDDPNDEVAIRVEGVSKSFTLPHNKQSSLKGALINLIGRGDRTYETQEVLKDVSFEIKKGEFFGIVGRNGSGKSTLLKMLAGIYTPTSGKIMVNGSLTPFIELGVGFNPELTGRDNVYLNCALLGFNEKEVDDMYQDIVDFAELERFMDQKLKNYSSGMQVRLAFSIAIQAKGAILLLDEVLAVGDEAFQRKCYDYFETLKRNKKTVVLVTHDMAAVERFCNNAILIEQGEIIKRSDVISVTNQYRSILTPPSDDEKVETPEEEAKRWGDGSYRFSNVSVEIVEPAKYGSEINILADIYCKKELKEDQLLAFAIKDATGQVLLGDKQLMKIALMPRRDQKKRIQFTLNNILSSGKYFVDLSILSPKSNIYSDIWIDCGTFRLKTLESSAFTVMSPSALNIKNIV